MKRSNREAELEKELQTTRSFIGDFAIRTVALERATETLLDLAAEHWKDKRPAGWYEAAATAERLIRQGRKS